MKKLGLDFGMLFQRQVDADEDPSMAWDRMAREIRGSILTLVALFELVSLTSYIPLDSFNLFDGRFDHMNNMGGIVGAAVSEWLLGTVGIAGYAIIGLTLWLCFCAFRGIPLRNNFLRILGTVLGAILTAITCHICLSSRFPEASLMQGGVVGAMAGGLLERYFNTAGALLLVGGGLVVTLILTTDLSLTRLTERLFREEEEPEAPAPRPQPVAPLAPSPALNAPEEPGKPSRTRKRSAAKKKGADGETDPSSGPDSDGGEDEEKTDELDLNQAAGGAGNFQQLIPFTGSYQLPSLRLLKNGEAGASRLSRSEMKENARKLREHLLSFQITGEVVNATQGPVLITYEFKPSAGIKLSKIAALQEDLGVVLGTRELRIIAPIPGKTVVGIEVPRPEREVIPLKEVLGEDEFHDKKLKLPVALGKGTDGRPAFADLAAMPHLLVAGGTGSGKSVFVNSLIMSFLYRLTPQQLRLVLVDPKMLELSVFDGIPHLVTNVITNHNIAFSALNWAVEEMEQRYKKMSETGSKNLESYNAKQKNPAEKLPFIVIVVDELADLMMSGGDIVEVAITRLAQKARAAGLHLVIATQRPSTDVVTGLIKANMPSRLAFKVPSAIDSRTVLDASGAEDLIGKGDSLMILPGVPMRRLHGTFLTEDELARVVNYIKGGRNHSKNYIQFK